MKKNLFPYLLFIIISLCIPNITFGILSDSLSLDMYKKVDKWIYDLEIKYLEKELKWWDILWSITEDLNKRAGVNHLKNDCFKPDMTIVDIKNIVNNYDLSSMLEWCLWEEDAKIWSSTYNQYVNIIKESYNENQDKAQKKVNQIYKIGRIGMYSDGLEENSPFDLMVDLDEIDTIIFESNIPYNGVNTEDLWKVTAWVLKWMTPHQAYNGGKYKTNTPLSSSTNSNPIGNGNTPSGTTNIPNDGSTQICTTDTSWLDTKSLNGILWTWWKWKTGIWWDGNTWNGWHTGVWWVWNTWNTAPSYTKVDDTSIWPCNNFFCIVIKFVMYDHKLLGWWKNLSIEWLIKRSNEHFKKFTATSLIQAVIPLNNFQSSILPNLVDMFHVGIEVSYKPVPIINVKSESKDSKNTGSDEFKHKNLLTRYYKNLWLDYERPNDLDIFIQKEAELKSVLDATELAQTQAQDKKNSFNTYIEWMKKENEFISQTIVDKKIIQDDMQDFYKQFTEIESFTNAILNYTLWAEWVINKMNEIPKW